MTDVGGVDPDGVGVVQTGRFLADFDLEYRVNMIQAYLFRALRAQPDFETDLEKSCFLVIYNTLLLQEKYAIRVARLGHGAPLGGAEIFILGGVNVGDLFVRKDLSFIPRSSSLGRRGVFVFQ